MTETGVELTCTICARPFIGERRRDKPIGPRPEHAACWSARNRIDRIIRTVREDLKAKVRCRFCGAAPEPGSKYCTAHQFRRDPCARCGGRIRRLEGLGRQPAYCDGCRTRRGSFSSTAAGGSGQ